MARPQRPEFAGAIYHVMSRGNARQVVFRDERDYQRMVDGLEQTVTGFGWELLSFVHMPNHFHGIDSDQFQVRRSRELSRDVAAWLCRRLVSDTLRELAPAFGVEHPDSVRNLVRRVDRALSTSRSPQKDLETLRDQLMKTAYRA